MFIAVTKFRGLYLGLRLVHAVLWALLHYTRYHPVLTAVTGEGTDLAKMQGATTW